MDSITGARQRDMTLCHATYGKEENRPYGKRDASTARFVDRFDSSFLLESSLLCFPSLTGEI